jgi:hypothetical protein
MKMTLRLLLFFVTLSPWCLAQHFDEPVRNLSDEEIRLVQAYRRDPEPFRRLMYEHDERSRPQRPHSRIPLGPRDVIDVAVEGGSIMFTGHNYFYDPVTFRISRGEQIEVVFRRQKSSSETRVNVAYRADGLHFDVPDQRPGTESLERGLLILAEDPRWEKGDLIQTDQKLNAKRSRSRADHVTFRIRYALTR